MFLLRIVRCVVYWYLLQYDCLDSKTSRAAGPIGDGSAVAGSSLFAGLYNNNNTYAVIYAGEFGEFRVVAET